MGTRIEWTYPSETQEYKATLADNAESPHFVLLESLDVGRGSFRGAGHAWIVKDIANGIVCLQSYATIVSVACGPTVRHLGKWSRTTSGHQSRFAAYMQEHAGRY